MLTGPAIQALIERARQGDREALGQLLDHHRPYLRLLTQRMIGQRLGGRLDDSDIVQQTCLSIFGKIPDSLAGGDEFVAWLRTVHERNVKNALREHVGTQKRSLRREETGAEVADVDEWLTLRQSSPSQRLMRGEKSVRLAAALQALPADQREAIRLRYLEGLSLAEISEQMQRTRQSVAGLVKRGLMALRKELGNEIELLQ